MSQNKILNLTPAEHDRILSYKMLNDENGYSLFVQHFASKKIPAFVFEPYMQYICKQFQIHANGVIQRQELIRKMVANGEPYNIDKINEKVGINENVIVNIPPQHTKSTILTIMSIAWLFAKNPSFAIAVVSNGSDLSKTHGEIALSVIEHEDYKRLFPYVAFDKDNEKSKVLKLVKGYERQGRLSMVGIGSAITGKHFDFILLDDPNKASDGNSYADRKAVQSYIGGVMLTRLRPGACVFLIQQRVCKDDATDYVLKTLSNAKWIKLPDMITPDVKPYPLGLKALYQLNDNGELVLSRRVSSYQRQTAVNNGTYPSQYQQSPSEAQEDIYVYNFDAPKHIKECTYNPALPLYVGTDFNTNNNTAVLVQTDLHTFFFVLDEIKTNTGGVPAMCKNIANYMNEKGIPLENLLFCPDATGHSVRAETNTSCIAELVTGLQINKSQILHGAYNPSFVKINMNMSQSHILINKLLVHLSDVRISSKCEKLRWDFENIVKRPTTDGSIETNKDHVPNSPYNANALDSWQYIVQRLYYTYQVSQSPKKYISALDIYFK